MIASIPVRSDERAQGHELWILVLDRNFTTPLVLQKDEANLLISGHAFLEQEGYFGEVWYKRASIKRYALPCPDALGVAMAIAEDFGYHKKFRIVEKIVRRLQSF